MVGHINVIQSTTPTLTVDLSRLNRMIYLDETSRLATFEVGISGAHLEAQLRARGYTLGHFPQSFEYSTLGRLDRDSLKRSAVSVLWGH